MTRWRYARGGGWGKECAVRNRDFPKRRTRPPQAPQRSKQTVFPQTRVALVNPFSTSIPQGSYLLGAAYHFEADTWRSTDRHEEQFSDRCGNRTRKYRCA